MKELLYTHSAISSPPPFLSTYTSQANIRAVMGKFYAHGLKDVSPHFALFTDLSMLVAVEAFMSVCGV